MTVSLRSWYDTDTKRTILRFVASVIDESSPHYVPPAERIAVFDNDGTLWCEKPMYIQLDFILRKLAARAESDPSLRSHQPWQAAWEKDFAWLGGAITQHYQGDDSALHMLLDGILALSDGQAVEQVEADAMVFVENAWATRLRDASVGAAVQYFLSRPAAMSPPPAPEGTGSSPAGKYTVYK